jgi:hypothetical protein
MTESFVTYGLDEAFPGKIGKTIDDSTEAWPMPIQAPEGAPNVLFYVLDDVGFGQLEPFGGLVKAPDLQAHPRSVNGRPDSRATTGGSYLRTGSFPRFSTCTATTHSAWASGI